MCSSNDRDVRKGVQDTRDTGQDRTQDRPMVKNYIHVNTKKCAQISDTLIQGIGDKPGNKPDVDVAVLPET